VEERGFGWQWKSGELPQRKKGFPLIRNQQAQLFFYHYFRLVMHLEMARLSLYGAQEHLAA